jgi:hypothetical protein
LIRVAIPQHLRTLAGVRGEVELSVPDPVTRERLLDALEARYPVLRGTIRDHVTRERRPFLRFFACATDLTFEEADAVLPKEVLEGREPFLVVGSIAGG